MKKTSKFLTFSTRTRNCRHRSTIWWPRLRNL